MVRLVVAVRVADGTQVTGQARLQIEQVLPLARVKRHPLFVRLGVNRREQFTNTDVQVLKQF